MPLEALRYDVTPTGLHYLLSHFDIPDVEPASWRLEISGLVEKPMSISLDDLLSMPAATATVTLECAGNGRALMDPFPGGQPWRYGGVSTARWRGVPLAKLLAEAGLEPEAVEVVFAGADLGVEEGIEQRFQRSLPVADAMRPDVLVAYEMNGEPLPPQHGGPARLVVPGWYGMASVKWLVAIEAIPTPFNGYQQESYEIRPDDDTPGQRITRMLPRSLLEPPGLATDDGRLVRSNEVLVEGRAWSGAPPVVRVEISVDDGLTWTDAAVGEPSAPTSWSAWRATVVFPAPGRYVLRSRATDAEGRAQPLDPSWNAWGYQNNVCERVPIEVAS